MKNYRVIVGVVLVFLLGIACGGLATHLLYKCRIESIVSGRAQNRESAILDRLDRKLDLDRQQEEQVRAIVHETHEEIQALRKKHRPETQAVLERSQARISAILTPGQQKKYEQIIAERKERMRKKGQ